MPDDDIFSDVEPTPAAPEPAAAAPPPTPTQPAAEKPAEPKAANDAMSELVKESEKLGLYDKPKADIAKMSPEVAKALPVKDGKLILDKIFKKGCIFKLSIGYWTAKKKLTPKDLGLAKADVPEEIVALGQKRLLKKSSFDEISSIEGKARSLVETNSHESWVPGLRFMTTESLKSVMADLTELRKEFMKKRDEFVEQYPSLKTAMANEFPDWAAKLEPLYPTQEQIKKSFYFEMDSFEITLAKQEAAILADAEVAIKDQLASKLNDFLTSTVKDTRKLFIEELSFIKEKLDSGDKVHGKTVKKIQEMIEQAKNMNFVDDAEFMTMLEDFKKKYGDKDAINAEEAKKAVTADLNALLAKASDETSAEETVNKYYRSLIV